MSEKIAEVLAKAAMRLRIDAAADWHHPLAAWLDAEAEDAARCPGEKCDEYECPGDFGPVNTRKHHHCRFCRDEAPSLEVADSYLWHTIGAAK
jgi:hypothetical protein